MSAADNVKLTQWGLGLIAAIVAHSLFVGYWAATIRSDVDYLKGDVQELKEEMREYVRGQASAFYWRDETNKVTVVR